MPAKGVKGWLIYPNSNLYSLFRLDNIYLQVILIVIV